MSRKDMIRQLFMSSSSSDSSTFNPWFRIKPVILILITLFIIEVMFSFGCINKRSAENKQLISKYESFESSVQDQLAWQKIARAYNDNHPVTITKNRNTGDSIKLSGYIKNSGTREIGMVILTAMCLDSRSFLSASRPQRLSHQTTTRPNNTSAVGSLSRSTIRPTFQRQSRYLSMI